MQARLPRLAGWLVPALFFAPALWATWSIVAVDTATGEVAVASATCVSDEDLAVFVGICVPERGAAATQSYVPPHSHRLRIWNGLIDGVSPDEVLATLAEVDMGHPMRQYGIADLSGRPATFTGSSAHWWRGGVTGHAGTIAYAIQGNVLAGAPVVQQAELALVGTAGDLSQKMMAAMEAARSMGGDGRCSCNAMRPMECGSPPPAFDKAAHTSFLIVSRPGDSRGVCTDILGCVNGDYYLFLNEADLSPSDPDPVLLLEADYAAWRSAQAGRPDAVRSLVDPPAVSVRAGSTDPVAFTVELSDLDGTAIQVGGAAVSLEHDPRSAGGAVLQSVQDHGDGTYTVTVLPGPQPGVDRLRLVVDDGVRPVVLWPPVELVVQAPPQGPFNQLEAVPGLDDPAALDRHAKILADGRTAYLLSTRDGRPKRLMRATRPAATGPFGPAADVPGLNTFDGRFSGFWISDDELRIVFSAVQGAQQVERLYRAERGSPGDPFDTPVKIAAVNSGFGDAGPWVSPDELQMFFHSARPGGGGGGLDLWVSRRYAPGGRWLPPDPILGLNTAADESYPVLAAGGTRLYFSRAGDPGAEDLCMADWQAGAGFLADSPLPGTAHAARRMAASGLAGGGSLLLLSLGDPSGGTDLLQAALTVDALTASTDFVSVSAGGALDFTLAAGPEFAGGRYQLVLGASGPVPGLRFGTAVLPLAGDAATVFSRRHGTAPMFTGFRGTLDAGGSAAARLTIAAGTPLKAAALGRDYLAAFLALSGGRSFASNSVLFRLDP